MSKSIKFTLTVKYTNGIEQSFEFFPELEKNMPNLASYLQKVMSSRELIIELEDRLLVIPIQNIQTIEISPPPPKLPEITLRNGRLLDN
ncbi:hypothetical protein [Okeania sp. SIO2B3]|uniref:hypothetical protein n=2 Tax=Okeania TaxID=1458928 RepID=UPI0013BF52D7|nr:hypothetical protein [Okeania sp. SIO2B3]NET40699.1 hypothetical protein [Okeania sp. SIO2B3]